MATAPLLEDELRDLTRSPLPGAVHHQPAWSGRGWLVAVVAMVSALLLMLPFSLAGIAGLVRFRNALDDTKDAMYVFVAMAVGLGEAEQQDAVAVDRGHG